MNIKTELKSNQIILVLMPSADYSTLTLEVLKGLVGERVCYVTLNKTSPALKEIFEKNGISAKNIVFIDCISKTIKECPEYVAGCYFIESPGALTELSLCITKVLAQGFTYLIFDSLTNLLIYEKSAPVAKFVSAIATEIRETKTKAVFYALNITKQEELMEECEMFVDRVINLKKGVCGG